MKQMAKTVRNKRELLLNWFQANGAFSSGVFKVLTINENGPPENRVVSATKNLMKPSSITTSAPHLNQFSPTDSSNQAIK